MYSKLTTVYHTVKHLKLTQIFHQLKYRLISPKPLKFYGAKYLEGRFNVLKFRVQPKTSLCLIEENKFSFLNQVAHFEQGIDWNFQDHGKLWNYNLQYANYLYQLDIDDHTKTELMRSQYEWLLDGRLTLEPYPASLRAINMIRWMSVSSAMDAALLKNLHAELDFLSTRLEYHLLGNHLLENAFALMMGGAFFINDSWIKVGKRILEKELLEQILSDGAHFELSPMYHQIIFFRILELIDWYSTWDGKDADFERFLRIKASDMLAWLKNISFENGDIPHFNDSATGIAYSTEWLSHYADVLGVISSKRSLGESGYRSIRQGGYELKIDFAQLGPSYQPGHAHADALSFVLYQNGKPLFVEQGTSTYQIGVRRDLERSTQAHNAVVVNNTNQSEVWGGFRVARRARTTILKDGEHEVYEALHDGYKRYGLEHIRSFKPKESAIVIEDCLSKSIEAICFLHLCPKVAVHEIQDNTVLLSNGVRIDFEGANSVRSEDYSFSDSYNVYESAQRIVIPFTKGLITTIYF